MEPIVYERVEGPDGRPMWKVPEHERERWDAGPIRAPVVSRSNALSHSELLDLLEPVVSLSTHVSVLLARAHEAHPERTTRSVESFLESVQRGGIYNPAGLLHSKLAAIVA